MTIVTISTEEKRPRICIFVNYTISSEQTGTKQPGVRSGHLKCLYLSSHCVCPGWSSVMLRVSRQQSNKVQLIFIYIQKTSASRLHHQYLGRAWLLSSLETRSGPSSSSVEMLSCEHNWHTGPLSRNGKYYYWFCWCCRLGLSWPC